MTTSKFWVSMTDSFMSGWGRAEGKTNKLVIECDSLAQARVVERNCKNSDEMLYVNICSKKPYYNNERYLTSRNNANEMPRFTKS